MFAYPDAQRYRLGASYQQLPCDRPVSEVYSPYQRDGAMRYMSTYGNDLNYVNSSRKAVKFMGRLGANGRSITAEHDEWVGRVTAYASEVTDEDIEQARAMWELLGKAKKEDVFISNVVAHISSADPSVQQGAIGEYSQFINGT